MVYHSTFVSTGHSQTICPSRLVHSSEVTSGKYVYDSKLNQISLDIPRFFKISSVSPVPNVKNIFRMEVIV
jgi:hypothetical protein